MALQRVVSSLQQCSQRYLQAALGVLVQQDNVKTLPVNVALLPYCSFTAATQENSSSSSSSSSSNTNSSKMLSNSSDGSKSSDGSNSSTQQQQHRRRTAIFAACVLERLPIVKSPPPEWEAEQVAWLQLARARDGLMKQYPVLDKKQATSEDDGAQATPDPSQAAFTTRADRDGLANTMKRRLAEKVVLLIKARSNPAAAAAAARELQQQSEWTFPLASHQADESIRETAERALKSAIGPAAVYFVGNAPMAHLDIRGGSSSSSESSSKGSSESSSGSSSESSSNSSAPDTGAATAATRTSSRLPRAEARVFFHLAQVVNDPWDVLIKEDVAEDHAWVTKEELGNYLADQNLLALAHRML